MPPASPVWHVINSHGGGSYHLLGSDAISVQQITIYLCIGMVILYFLQKAFLQRPVLISTVVGGQPALARQCLYASCRQKASLTRSFALPFAAALTPKKVGPISLTPWRGARARLLDAIPIIRSEVGSRPFYLVFRPILFLCPCCWPVTDVCLFRNGIFLRF